MSFRLFSVSSMYQGSLDSFYNSHLATNNLTYKEHLNLLLESTTEFVGSYMLNFRKLKIEAECAIANDPRLQLKWAKENALNPDTKHKIIFDQIRAFLPEVLLIENLSFVTPDLLSSIRQQVKSIRLIVANHCAPFNSRVLDSLNEVDFVFTCTPGLKSVIEDMGKKSYLVYHGFDADLLKRIDPDCRLPKNDFIFSGSLISGGDFHAKRIRLIERILEENIQIGLYVNLESKYRIKVKQSIYLFSALLKKMKIDSAFKNFGLLQHGKTWVNDYSDNLMKHKNSPLYGIDMLNLFLNSRIVLNFHIGIAGDYAGNMRMFEVTGVGSCLLTDNKKNMPELFNTSNEVVVYENAEDCIEKARWLIDHEDERKRIALAGQQRTLKFHTVENRCRTIINILENELIHSA